MFLPISSNEIIASYVGVRVLISKLTFRKSLTLQNSLNLILCVTPFQLNETTSSHLYKTEHIFFSMYHTEMGANKY